jgi:glutamate racemase
MTTHTSYQFRHAPIGVTDSGVGGFSILREMQQLMPNEDFIYLADQWHVPYGQRTLQQVRYFEEGITRFFLNGFGDVAGAKLIVIPCNTACAAALHHLRETFTQIRYVGIEPAIKPAAERSRSKHIGVIATAATFQGELYASLIDRFAQGLEVHTRACPEFVTLVERGGPYDAADRALVKEILAPLVVEGIDELVLGCTHFSFLTPEIQAAVGEGVGIIDPRLAVAKQAQRVLEEAAALNDTKRQGHTIYITTGDVEHFRRQVETLLGVMDADIRVAHWSADDSLLTIA